MYFFLFFFSFPDLKQQQCTRSHTANSISLKFDPSGKYFAVGGADAGVSIFDANEFICVATVDR